ncbi:MAG: FAD-dependent oxidoreductase [Candidatus Eremiobacteraeota bacterium]|nr:FAD-dependent oxidoreductase [Candidatus Eremiobacteraeota bacterium]
MKNTPHRPSRKYNEKIAIIGAGPAGLSCAYHLVEMGYKSEIFDENPIPGGMMIYGVPSSRIPTDVLMSEIENLYNMGIVIHSRRKIRPENIDDMFESKYDAVFIGCGLWKPGRLGIPGEDIFPVYSGLNFLKKFNIYERKLEKDAGAPKVGKKVIIIGGGNVAMDVAIGTMRLGAEEVRVVCLESFEEMPSYKNERALALAMGVRFHTGIKPLRITGKNGVVTGVAGIKVSRNGENIVETSDTEIFLPADTVIEAIGQRPDIGFISGLTGVEHDDMGLIKVNRDTMKTGRAGIFAGGDIVSGGTNIARAIKEGKIAAISIDKYLKSLKINSPHIA